MVIWKKRKGFTLTELLITVGIIGIVFAVGAPILNQSTRNFFLSRARLELQQEARSLMYIMTRNIRQAQSNSITISRANANQPFYSQITFTKIQGDTITFRQEGVNFVQVIGGRPRALSSNLKYLAFTFPRSDDMGIISISMTLEKSLFEGRTKALHLASEKVRIMN